MPGTPASLLYRILCIFHYTYGQHNLFPSFTYATLGPYIAKRRTPEVQKKYAEIGGGSPILKWTNIQCTGLVTSSGTHLRARHMEKSFKSSRGYAEVCLTVETDNLVIVFCTPLVSFNVSRMQIPPSYTVNRPQLAWGRTSKGELMCQKLDVVSPQTAPHKHYVAFRYVDPLTEQTLDSIQKEGAERVVIFSQYPQYSCATSGSSLNAIFTYFKNKSKPKNVKWSLIDRWSVHPLLAKTFADRITTELKQFPAEKQKEVVILFSAHSLPLKAVNRGDPYPGEVGATVQLVMQELGHCNPYSLVWQSKVGPLPWLEPYTDDAIRGYVKQGKKNFILVPIAFVNEHIETLHEMDIEYCHDLGKELGVESIRRAAAPNDHPLFISALTDIVATHLKEDRSVNPKFLIRCPHCTNQRCHEAKKFFAELCI